MSVYTPSIVYRTYLLSCQDKNRYKHQKKKKNRRRTNYFTVKSFFFQLLPYTSRHSTEPNFFFWTDTSNYLFIVMLTLILINQIHIVLITLVFIVAYSFYLFYSLQFYTSLLPPPKKEFVVFWITPKKKKKKTGWWYHGTYICTS